MLDEVLEVLLERVGIDGEDLLSRLLGTRTRIRVRAVAPLSAPLSPPRFRKRHPPPRGQAACLRAMAPGRPPPSRQTLVLVRLLSSHA